VDGGDFMPDYSPLHILLLSSLSCTNRTASRCEGHYKVITAKVRVKRVAKRLEGNRRKYTGMGNVEDFFKHKDPIYLQYVIIFFC
jgi:uncharacterized OsmC-like protein